MAIYRLDEHSPQLAHEAWVADNAQVIGRVTMGEQSSVWYGCVLRGDSEEIILGARTNVQDGSVLHADPGFPCVLGDDVTVGHQVMLHGCSVGDGSLIGIQAVILNGARIGKNCIVGAGAVVTEGKEFPDNSLIFGAPAKWVREVSAEQAERSRHAALHYVENAQLHRRGLRRID